MVDEEIVSFGEQGQRIGIITKNNQISNHDFCIIFLCAGLIHKIGPNRIYVDASRTLAEQGFVSFRFDYYGIGDCMQVSNSSINRIDEIISAMNKVNSIAGINKFILIGICSGAEEAFNTIIRDNRIIGAVLIDGIYLNHDVLINAFPKAVRKTAIRYYKKNLFSYKRWINLLRGQNSIINRKTIVMLPKYFALFIIYVFRRLLKKRKNTVTNHKTANTDPYNIKKWQAIFQNERNIYLIFCEGGNAIDLYNGTVSNFLSKYKNNNQLCVKYIKDVDHTFTPIWSQELLIETIKNWIVEYFTGKL